MLPSPLRNLTGLQQAQVETTLRLFYTIPRAGAARLSDGGGPFGFDIHVALLVDDLLSAYMCDAIVETGCYLGDTTEYLARRYPGLPLHTCDIEAAHAEFTRARLQALANVHVGNVDSPLLVGLACVNHKTPLFYLDAHWGEDWPLIRELTAITRGIVLIHDFDIGHPRFSYDAYNGVACGPDLLARLPSPPDVYFTPIPGAHWPLPCLQTGRRAGVGIVPIGVDADPLRQHPALQPRILHPETEVSA
jgi:hypothetical protein